MNIADGILIELEQEAQITNRVLGRIPEGKFGWKPHQKSMSLGELSWHIASIPGWAVKAAKPDVYEFSGEEQAQAPSAKSEIVSGFQKGLDEAKAYLSQLDDSAAVALWKIAKDGKVLIEMPRIAFIRTVLLSHICHHRGQLSVYLRLLDIPVPAIYGSSADENNFA